MSFLQFLKSLDDLLYELMSWLVFFPITLWRAVMHPLATMDYADRELDENVERQYDETLSPPQFLLVSLLVSHVLELAIVGQSELVADKVGLAALVHDDTSLLLFRLIVFSLFPMILALRMLRQRGSRVTRDSLRDPFYAQCFPAGPYALAMGLSGIGLAMHDKWLQLGGFVLFLAALVWFTTVQVLWFRSRLKISTWRALGSAIVGMAECIVAVAIVAVIV